MLLKSIILVSLSAAVSYGVRYDYYTGQPATKDQLKFYESQNLTDTCTIDIKPCDETEWRRSDGSCNNLNYAGRGTYLSPVYRELPAHYYNGSFQRKAESGKELPLARIVRSNLLKEGKSSHPRFNHNVPGFGAYLFNDVSSDHDVANVVGTTNYCCEKEHMHDYVCTPNIIPPDDHVHRYSGIQCMNSTRPLTLQDYNCTTASIPSPLKKATSEFDCSQIYNAYNNDAKVIRSYYKGELKMEEEDGKMFPPNGPTACCPSNVGTETRCFENYYNTLLPVILFTVWFSRHHNYIARQLAEINPCWDDEMLFETAKDINIAYYQQMYLYEWLAALQGRDNLIKAGVITKDGGFRDIYDKKKYPQVSLEFTYILRWFHLMQESTAKLYDGKGHFIKTFPIFNVTFRTGLLAEHNNMEYFTQSTIRAGCHDHDGSVDYEIGNNGLPGYQKSIDAPSGDLNKCRHFGLAPYIDYVRHFTGREITCFDDLADLIPKDKLLRIKEVYDHVRDMDLGAGTWVEIEMEGGHIPRTNAEIMNANVLRAIKSDRHWYERPNRPHAFTKAQLAVIRKTSLALLLCNVGDGVYEIPRHAFLNISPENPLVKCCDIENMDFSAWADESCNKSDC